MPMAVKLAGSVVKYPARVSLGWYLALIVLGTLALHHPLCHNRQQESISWLDAAFTSTSATCVTGLIVRSTEHDFSLVGQAVILVLIQLGGIGIMTVTTYVMFHLGSRESLQHRLIISETLGADATDDLRKILRNVLLLAFAFESLGFLLLFARNAMDYPLAQAAWQALFHTISAFCNAGFSLHDDSLVRYQGDPVINLTMCGLIVAGGIGFPVILDIRRQLRWRGWDRWHRLHLHSKLTLITTAALILGGTICFTFLEWDGVLADKPFWQRPLIGLFQSVTCRTAGFNSVNIGDLTNASLFVCILLMAVGAGSCSTGGGFKVSTLAVLVMEAWAAFRGAKRINVFRRTVAEEAVVKAETLLVLFVTTAILALTMLLVFEQSSAPHPQSQGLFLDAFFEVTSALGTVGLSVGLTPHLTAPGRIIIIVLMFIGRLGPISVFAALSQAERKSILVYPDEEPMIG